MHETRWLHDNILAKSDGIFVNMDAEALGKEGISMVPLFTTGDTTKKKKKYVLRLPVKYIMRGAMASMGTIMAKTIRESTDRNRQPSQ